MNINIIKHNTILYLNNIEYSPYWYTLYNSCITCNKDNNGNTIFYEDYDLEHIKCYIDHCNNGYIRRESFCRDLFDYMGHECNVDMDDRDQTKVIYELQREWRKKYGGYVLFTEEYIHGYNEINDEVISSMNKIFYDVKYISLGLSEGRENTYKVIVFCPRNNCSHKLFFDGRVYLIRYVEDNISPRDYIIRNKLQCYYDGIYYMDSI